MKHFRQFALLGFVFLCPFTLLAQDTEPPPVTMESPHNTMYVHLYYLQPDSYQPTLAARTLNTTADSTKAVRRAIQLKQILDGKGLYVHLNLLPDDPNYVDTITDKSMYTPFPDALPEVYLEKVDTQWLYSSQTVAAIPDLHGQVYPFGTEFLLNLIPAGTHQSFLGLKAWQWIGIGLVLLIAWIFHFLLSRIIRPIVRLLARSKYSQPLEDKSMLWRVSKIASILIVLWLVKSFLPALQFPVETMSWLVSGLEIASVILWVWLGLSVLEVVMSYAHRYASSTEQKLDDQLLPILQRMVQVILVIGAIIYILRLLDVNVTALIAGVSIGGLALALAAQDTVKNLLGSAMIFFDKPFQIGDWVVVGDTEGEIAEVGFRSTRIQTVDSSIVSVPNHNISTTSITNMGIRQYRMFKTMLGVTYDTPPILLEKFIHGLRQLIEEHPLTRNDNYLVYFHSFGDSSLNIYFRAHIGVLSFQEELEEREKLAFGILKLAEALGVRFAFPTQTLFVEELPGSGTTTPSYETKPDKLDDRIREFFETEKSGQDNGT